MAGMFSFGKKSANIKVQVKSYNNNSQNYEQNFEVESDVVVNATDAPSDTGAKESGGFFSFLKDIFSKDGDPGAGFFDKVRSTLDDIVDSIFDDFIKNFAVNRENLIGPEDYHKEKEKIGLGNAEKQKQELADNFYNTTFQELNKKYDGRFKATNGEEAIIELTDYSKQLAEEIKRLDKNIKSYGFSDSVSASSFDYITKTSEELNKKQRELEEINNILASYKMANDQIEFNSIYTEYEKVFQEEFSKNYTIDPNEFEAYLKIKFEADNQGLTYEDWYNKNYINLFMDFYNSQYENWKITKYYSTENFGIFDKNAYDQLTDSEIATYNYLYTEFGKEAAKDYLDFMEEEINRRKGYELAQEFLVKLDGSNSDYAYTAAKGWVDGLESFGEGLSNWINGDAKLDVSDYETMYIIQGLQSGEIANSNIFLDHAYQILSSVGNMTIPMVAGLVLPGGSVISTSLLGISAAGNAYDSALEGGNTEMGSRLYSLFVGASEATLSYFLSGIPGMSGLEKTLAGKLAGEFTEEFLQTYIETFLAVAFLDDTLDSVDWDKLLLEAGQAGIYGLITAAVMNGTVEVGKVLCETSDLEFCVAYGGLLYDLYNNTDNPTDFKDALEQNHPELVDEYNDYLENQTNEQDTHIGEDLNSDVDVETHQVSETENTGNVGDSFVDINEEVQEIIEEQLTDKTFNADTKINMKEIFDKSLKSFEKFNPDATDLQKARFVYNLLNSSVFYDPFGMEVSNNMEKYQDYLNEKMNSNVDLEAVPAGVVCAEWANVYSQMLTELGIENYQLTNSEHSWVVFKIGDKYYIADGTQNYLSKNKMIDVGNTSNINSTNGFFEITEYTYNELINDPTKNSKENKEFSQILTDAADSYIDNVIVLDESIGANLNDINKTIDDLMKQKEQLTPRRSGASYEAEVVLEKILLRESLKYDLLTGMNWSKYVGRNLLGINARQIRYGLVYNETLKKSAVVYLVKTDKSYYYYILEGSNEFVKCRDADMKQIGFNIDVNNDLVYY